MGSLSAKLALATQGCHRWTSRRLAEKLPLIQQDVHSQVLQLRLAFPDDIGIMSWSKVAWGCVYPQYCPLVSLWNSSRMDATWKVKELRHAQKCAIPHHMGHCIRHSQIPRRSLRQIGVCCFEPHHQPVGPLHYQQGWRFQIPPAAVAQWLRLRAAEPKDMGSIPSRSGRCPHGGKKRKRPCIRDFSARLGSPGGQN